MDKIKNIAKYLKKRVDQEEQLVVVVSAMGKTTDHLVDQSKEITNNPNETDLAMLLTSGEQQTISFLSMALNDLSVPAKALTGYQAGIATVGRHMKSRISSIDTELFKKLFHRYDVLVVAGFQGFNEVGELTTLGRGGSDTTAVALASALNLPCEIYSDVTGIYSTDPSVYPEATLHKYISYDDMMEMSALGAGVLETRSVEIAKNYDIPLYLGKTLSEQKGTWVINSDDMLERKAVSGVALDNNVLHVQVHYPKYDSYLFHDILVHLEREDVSIDMISEIHTHEGFQFTFTTKETEKYLIQQSFASLEEAYPGLEVTLADRYSKISLVGSGMRDISRVVSKALRTLIKGEISFYQVTTSEVSVSFIVKNEEKEKVTKLLCQAFNL
jgi:aspartate kinase